MYASANDVARFFDGVVNQTLDPRLGPDDYALMLSLLENQEVDTKLSTGFPADVVFAHKTGDGQPFIANDAGIVWVKNQPVVLVVFTGHHRGGTEALHDDIARVAALVVKHYGGKLSSDFK